MGKYVRISNSTIQLDSETRHYRPRWDYIPMSKCIASSFTRYQMKQREYFLNVDMILRQEWGEDTRVHCWCISKCYLNTWYNSRRMYRIHVLSLSGISVKNDTHRNRSCLIWNGWKGVYSAKGYKDSSCVVINLFVNVNVSSVFINVLRKWEYIYYPLISTTGETNRLLMIQGKRAWCFIKVVYIFIPSLYDSSTVFALFIDRFLWVRECKMELPGYNFILQWTTSGDIIILLLIQ